MHQTVTLDRLLAEAADLVSEEGENPEYDRALAELIAHTGLLPIEAYGDGTETSRPFAAKMIAERTGVGALPRGAASEISPGDTVHVFAHPQGRFGERLGADVFGTVVAVEPMSLRTTTSPGLLITMDDGRVYETVEHAATHWRVRVTEY